MAADIEAVDRLHLAFPAHVAQRWMPGLFPERAE